MNFEISERTGRFPFQLNWDNDEAEIGRSNFLTHLVIYFNLSHKKISEISHITLFVIIDFHLNITVRN